jgi:hypothetical protein
MPGHEPWVTAAYLDAGRVAEAIPLGEQTLSARERVLGADHPRTLRTWNSLALTYAEAGRAGLGLLRQGVRPWPDSYAGVVMRATIAYTSARILLLVVSMILLYLAGARGLLLLALAFVVSGIASFVLLSRQRDIMSGALMARIRNGRNRAAGFRARLEEGARAEDDED